MSVKKELAPKGMTFQPNEFFISDKYATILTVVSYPKYIAPGYLSNLTTGLSGVKIVIKHIPVAFEIVSKMLNKQIVDSNQSNLKFANMNQLKLLKIAEIII